MKPHAYIFRNATEALPRLLRDVLDYGATRPSRNGAMKELNAVQIQLTHPEERYQLAPLRKASLPAQIAESAWILAGRNDVDWLTNYLPQAKRFSDDGETWRGGYGPRLRAWNDDRVEDFDQLQHVVNVLTEDRDSRRAIMTIYTPGIDADITGLDIPCNQYVQFMIRDDELQMYVSIRSNDLMWGWSGINTFEWSVVHQALAEILGASVGPVTYSIASLHLYERHWGKANHMLKAAALEDPTKNPVVWRTHPVFAQGTTPSVENLDRILRHFFETEEAVRKGGGWVRLPDSPLFYEWLLVLEGWWKHNDGTAYLERHPDGTPAVWTAAHQSPNNKNSPAYKHTSNTVIEDRARKAAMDRHPAGKRTETINGRPVKPSNSQSLGIESEGFHVETHNVVGGSNKARATAFARDVSKLHKEKNEAYGDSWKRRGEMLGIMANLARKVDRLGANGGGDTATDTAVDLLVYLIKYDLWLMDKTGNLRSHIQATSGDMLSEGTNHPWHVRRYLDYLVDVVGFQPHNQNIKYVEQLEAALRDGFDRLETRVTNHDPSRSDTVDELIVNAFQLAIILWVTVQDDQARKHEAWKAGNATRVWAGYDDVDEDVEE